MPRPLLPSALVLALLAPASAAWALPAPYRIAATYASKLDQQLLVAVFKSDPEWVDQLLAAGASPNARFYGDAFGEEDALDFGVGIMEDFPAYVRLVQANDGRMTALMLATLNGNPPIVARLLARRADPNRRSGDAKDTALMAAVRKGQREIALQLLAAGTDVTLKNAAGETALVLAERYAQRELAELLRAKAQEVTVG